MSDRDESLLQARDALVEEVQAQLLRKLKRALQDEQNDLLDRLRGLRQPPTVAALLGTADEQADRYRTAALPFLMTAARLGAQYVGGGDDAEREAFGAGGQSVSDVAETLGVAIVDPLRNRLERVLADGGDDTRALADDIGNAYREWKSQRIGDVAADHVTAAFGRGSITALRPGTPVRWLVDDQDGPCPDCDDNALARPTPAGEPFPTGQRHPPAHRGCRCVVVPDDGDGG